MADEAGLPRWARAVEPMPFNYDDIPADGAYGGPTAHEILEREIALHTLSHRRGFRRRAANPVTWRGGENHRVRAPRLPVTSLLNRPNTAAVGGSAGVGDVRLADTSGLLAEIRRMDGLLAFSRSAMSSPDSAHHSSVGGGASAARFGLARAGLGGGGEAPLDSRSAPLGPLSAEARRLRLLHLQLNRRVASGAISPQPPAKAGWGCAGDSGFGGGGGAFASSELGRTQLRPRTSSAAASLGSPSAQPFALPLGHGRSPDAGSRRVSYTAGCGSARGLDGTSAAVAPAAMGARGREAAASPRLDPPPPFPTSPHAAAAVLPRAPLRGLGRDPFIARSLPAHVPRPSTTPDASLLALARAQRLAGTADGRRAAIASYTAALAQAAAERGAAAATTEGGEERGSGQPNGALGPALQSNLPSVVVTSSTPAIGRHSAKGFGMPAHADAAAEASLERAAVRSSSGSETSSARGSRESSRLGSRRGSPQAAGGGVAPAGGDASEVGGCAGSEGMALLVASEGAAAADEDSLRAAERRRSRNSRSSQGSNGSAGSRPRRSSEAALTRAVDLIAAMGATVFEMEAPPRAGLAGARRPSIDSDDDAEDDEVRRLLADEQDGMASGSRLPRSSSAGSGGGADGRDSDGGSTEQSPEAAARAAAAEQARVSAFLIAFDESGLSRAQRAQNEYYRVGFWPYHVLRRHARVKRFRKAKARQLVLYWHALLLMRIVRAWRGVTSYDAGKSARAADLSSSLFRKFSAGVLGAWHRWALRRRRLRERWASREARALHSQLLRRPFLGLRTFAAARMVSRQRARAEEMRAYAMALGPGWDQHANDEDEETRADSPPAPRAARAAPPSTLLRFAQPSALPAWAFGLVERVLRKAVRARAATAMCRRRLAPLFLALLKAHAAYCRKDRWCTRRGFGLVLRRRMAQWVAFVVHGLALTDGGCVARRPSKRMLPSEFCHRSRALQPRVLPPRALAACRAAKPTRRVSRPPARSRRAPRRSARRYTQQQRLSSQGYFLTQRAERERREREGAPAEADGIGAEGWADARAAAGSEGSFLLHAERLALEREEAPASADGGGGAGDAGSTSLIPAEPGAPAHEQETIKALLAIVQNRRLSAVPDGAHGRIDPYALLGTSPERLEALQSVQTHLSRRTAARRRYAAELRARQAREPKETGAFSSVDELLASAASARRSIAERTAAAAAAAATAEEESEEGRMGAEEFAREYLRRVEEKKKRAADERQLIVSKRILLAAQAAEVQHVSWGAQEAHARRERDIAAALEWAALNDETAIAEKMAQVATMRDERERILAEVYARIDEARAALLLAVRDGWRMPPCWRERSCCSGCVPWRCNVFLLPVQTCSSAVLPSQSEHSSRDTNSCARALFSSPLCFHRRWTLCGCGGSCAIALTHSRTRCACAKPTSGT